MNERIKKLLEQADLGYLFYKDEMLPGNVNPESMKRFAELIVQECANIAKLTDDDDGADYSSGRFWAGNDILTHFGVKQ